MSSEAHKLDIYFLPTMAPGHMIPTVHIARMFSRRGAKSTIITTPSNASQFSETIDGDRRNGLDIGISLIPFPWREGGLPEGCENISATTTPEMSLTFLHALDLLQQPVEHILQQGHPDCLIAGAFFPWTTAVARRLNIPRIVFYGTGFFPKCIFHILREQRPQDAAEEFEIPGLPHQIRMTRRQLPQHLRLRDGDDHPLLELARKVLAADEAGFGVVVNTFLELEPAYAALYRKTIGNRAWHIGPVSLAVRSAQETDDDCMRWLASKRPASVVYVCFGSMAIFQRAQLHEIAAALESSGQGFVWVIGKAAAEEGSPLPEGFEGRTEGRGLVVRGWAPQVGILEHAAVGGFVTHCGWNSLLEGVAAGVPMATWPLSGEQFFNEKLVTEILGTGIPVGAEEWTKRTDQRAPMGRQRIERALLELMVGERMRCRARELGEVAKRAVEEGGSSHADFNSLMEQIRMFPPSSSLHHPSV